MRVGGLEARHVRFAAALAALLLVAACLFVPGKFEARMTILRDGRFTYRYTGEVLFLTSHSAMDADNARSQAFNPAHHPCYGDPPKPGERPAAGSSQVELRGYAPPPPPSPPAPPAPPPPPSPPRRIATPDGPVPDMAPRIVEAPVIRAARPCTSAELEVRRRDWEKRMAAGRADRERERAQMKAMLGGIDPSDPATMTEFARRLQGQGGWKKVVHKGEGLFEVEYEISGRLDHDFVFPVFDRVDLIVPFVQATRLGTGRVRVTAPGFVKPSSGDWMGLSSAGTAAAMRRESRWPFREPEGTFTLVTDATILTNNTRDGPASEGGSQILQWTVSSLDRARPEALLQL